MPLVGRGLQVFAVGVLLSALKVFGLFSELVQMPEPILIVQRLLEEAASSFRVLSFVLHLQLILVVFRDLDVEGSTDCWLRIEFRRFSFRRAMNPFPLHQLLCVTEGRR